MIKSAGGLALSLAVAAHAASPPKRVALVGTGGRSRFYIDAIAGKFRDANELVALCDTNPGRLALAAKRAMSAPKTYLAAQFDTLLRETRPATVIVTTPDATHDDYIVRALDAGCNVITEKPMTTTPAKAQRILDACKRNDRHVRVLFNSWEGYQIAFNGTKGRIEHEMVEQVYLSGANMPQGGVAADGVKTRVIPRCEGQCAKSSRGRRAAATAVATT